MKCSRTFVFALMMCLGLGRAMAQPPAGMEGMGQTPPAAVSSLQDALATVVIGDIPGLLDQFGQLASQSNPSLSGDSLKAMLGTQVEDPDLAGLPAGSGAMMVLFPNQRPVLLMEVAEGSMEKYKSSAAAKGSVAETVEGLLAVAEDETGMAAAKAVAADAKAQLAGAGQPNVNALVRMQKSMQLYGPMLDMYIGMMGGMMAQAQSMAGTQPAANTEVAQKILEGELRGFVEVASQVDTVNLTVSFSERGAMLEKVVAPVAGSALSTLASAPAPSTEALSKLIAPGAGMQGYVSVNGPAFVEFLKSVMQTVSTKMQLDPAGIKAVEGALDNAKGIQGMAFNYLLPNQTTFNGVSFNQFASAEEASKAMAAWNQEMQTGSIGQFYKSLGMSMTFTVTEKAREVDGIAINQIVMDIDMPNKPAMYPMTVEQAVVDSMVVQSMGANSIDDAVKAAKAGGYAGATALKAVGALPQGANGYVDINAASLARSIAASVPQAQAEALQVVDKLEGASPIGISANVGSGSLKGALFVPADLINKLVELSQEQGGGAMGGGMEPMSETQPVM